MQGYLLPIVLAGLLAVPLLWRIGDDVTDGHSTLDASAGGESLKIRSFSLGDSEIQLDFSTSEEFLEREREALDLQKARFDKTEAE